MLRVCAASRLHFGLLSLPPPPGQAHDSGRHFGGAGLMVEEPGVHVSVRPAPRWCAIGPLADRALEIAQTFMSARQDLTLLHSGPAFEIHIEKCAPEHVGLGTGTQLGLAVARALALAHGLEMTSVELARHIGRGRRSALGIHGFDRGGFLVEGGKGPATSVAPLVARADFPESWHICLIILKGQQGLHGPDEMQAFARLKDSDRHGDNLCRLVLLGMLPALAEQDLPAFAEALYEFNRRVGEMFQAVQGGTYFQARGQAIVDFIRQQGVAGVGQSSWGPTLFAVVEEDRAGSLANAIREHFGLEPSEVMFTRAANQAAKTVNVP